jgi:hypothetical protein
VDPQGQFKYAAGLSIRGLPVGDRANAEKLGLAAFRFTPMALTSPWVIFSLQNESNL